MSDSKKNSRILTWQSPLICWFCHWRFAHKVITFGVWVPGPCQAMACGTEGSPLCMNPAELGDPSCFHTGFPLDQSSPGQSSSHGRSFFPVRNPNSNCYGICGTNQNIFSIPKPGLLRKAKEGIKERRKHCFCIHSEPCVGSGGSSRSLKAQNTQSSRCFPSFLPFACAWDKLNGENI